MMVVQVYLNECDAGLVEASSKPVQTSTGVSQEQCDDPMQDDRSSGADKLTGGSSQRHLNTHLHGTDIPVNKTGFDGSRREYAGRIMTAEAKKNKPVVTPGPKQTEPSSHTDLKVGNRSSVWCKSSWKEHSARR